MLMIRPHLLRDHRRQREPRRVKGRRQFMARMASHFAVGNSCTRSHVLNAGIVDQNIQPLRHDCTGLFHHRAFRHVGPRHIRPRKEYADLNSLVISFLHLCDFLRLAEAVEHDGGAGTGQGARDAQPDPAGRAGDQRYLPPERPPGIQTLGFDGNVHGLHAPALAIKIGALLRLFAAGSRAMPMPLG